MSDCGSLDPTWDEVTRRDYYQEHRSHGCLFVEGSGRAMRPRRFDTIVSLRLTGADMDMLSARQREGQSLSDLLRELIRRPEPIPAPFNLAEIAGTATCQHLSISNVISADCGVCGPLPIMRAVVTAA